MRQYGCTQYGLLRHEGGPHAYHPLPRDAAPTTRPPRPAGVGGEHNSSLVLYYRRPHAPHPWLAVHGLLDSNSDRKFSVPIYGGVGGLFRWLVGLTACGRSDCRRLVISKRGHPQQRYCYRRRVVPVPMRWQPAVQWGVCVGVFAVIYGVSLEHALASNMPASGREGSRLDFSRRRRGQQAATTYALVTATCERPEAQRARPPQPRRLPHRPRTRRRCRHAHPPRVPRR